MWAVSIKVRASARTCNSPLLVLDLGLDIIDSVRGFHLKGDGFSSETTTGKMLA